MSTHVSIDRARRRARRAGPARALALGAALLALAVTPALASAHRNHIRVSGTYAVYDVGTTQCAPNDASPDILVCSTTGFRSSYDGSLAGDVTSEFTNTINCRTGRTWGHGTETFTGSLNGSASGTLTWKIAFRAGFDCTTFAPSGFQGLSHIESSSGPLAGTRGLLFFGDVTYDGVLR